MKKKLTASALTLTTGLAIALLLTNSIETIAPLFSADSSTWVHYSKKEATEAQNGIREYWVRCGGEYRFTKPASGTIEEATEYDTSEFTSNDPRYIKYIKEDKVVFYNSETNSYDYSELGDLTGYTTSILPAVDGASKRVEFYKDNLSPTYSASILRVTNVINTKNDLTAIQRKIDTSITDGYYVLGSDLASPNTFVNSAPSDTGGVFKGTIDGRGHTISNPSFWGYRMVGQLNGGTIKNLNFVNISVFSVVAADIVNGTIENCAFNMASSTHSYSNYGMLTDFLRGKSLLKNVTIDYGTLDPLTAVGDHLTYPITAYNYAESNEYTFQNVSIKCLASVNMFKQDYWGRSLRPAEITYIDTYKFINQGSTTYRILYPSGNTRAKTAADFIADSLKKATSVTFPVVAFNPATTSFTADEPAIILGDPNAQENYFITTPSEPASYSIRNAGKAIFIHASDEYGWHPAAIKFLRESVGFENIGDGMFISSITDSSNVSLFRLNVSETSPFIHRKADLGDKYSSDCYADGYDITSYTNNEIYIQVPGISSDPKMSYYELYHTTMRLLYPGTYYNSHPYWYAVDRYNRTYSLYEGSYISWQLCFSCRGNTTEYNAMVNEMAENILTVFKNQTDKSKKLINIGIDDNNNACLCSTCRSRETTYGSKSGVLIKFVNDVSEIINSRVNEVGIDKITCSTFAYQQYRAAPIVSNNPTISCNEYTKIFLAPIEANFTHSISDDTYNSEAHTLFENWSKVGSIYSWLYDTNFSHYLFPYNSYYSIPESIRYMASIGTQMAYIEGQHNVTSLRTGFNALKKFLNGRIMIDTNKDTYLLIDKFFGKYFGISSTKMYKFFTQLKARLDQFDTNSTYKSILYSGGKRSIYSNIDNIGLWDRKELVSWMNLCDECYKENTDPKIKNHILAESIFPRFLLCTGFASDFDSATLLKLRQDFKRDATALNITLLMENNQTTMQSIYTSWGI